MGITIKHQNMRKFFFAALFISLTLNLTAQDTLFVRNGQKIPAVIVEKNDTEIRYRKYGPPASEAVYSVFVSDILSIHYSDGIIADYSQAGQNPAGNVPEKPIDNAFTMKSIRWSFGAGMDHFNRKMEDDLLLFWRNVTANPKATIAGNPVSIPVILRMNMVIGNSGRNRIGDELQLMFTPVDAINSSALNGSYELRLKNFYYNVIIYYGHTLNHKQNLIAIFEPGLDLAMMSGYIKLNNVKYNLSANLGVGFHQAAGLDWLVSKRIMLSGRAGYRFLKTKESHENDRSSTGYSSFHVGPGAAGDLLKVKWNGAFYSIGLSYSFYTKMMK